MRQLQKTENKSDRWGKISLEGGRQPRVCSAGSGEISMENDVSNSLKELILDRNNFNLAYKRVKKNKGAAGIDGITVDDAFSYLKEHGQELIKSLRAGTYRPLPVKRVEIPKPDGSKRKLGIPAVVDRIVQQAVLQVLSPIME